MLQSTPFIFLPRLSGLLSSQVTVGQHVFNVVLEIWMFLLSIQGCREHGDIHGDFHAD